MLRGRTVEAGLPVVLVEAEPLGPARDMLSPVGPLEGATGPSPRFGLTKRSVTSAPIPSTSSPRAYNIHQFRISLLRIWATWTPFSCSTPPKSSDEAARRLFATFCMPKLMPQASKALHAPMTVRMMPGL